MDNEKIIIEDIHFCMPVRLQTNKGVFMLFYDGMRNELFSTPELPSDLREKMLNFLKPQEIKIEEIGANNDS